MKLALLGDIAFDGSFDVVNNPGVKDGLYNVAKYLRSFDLVCCNLESPFTIKYQKGPAKSAYLGCHPENIILLKYLNVGICNLANNHMMDYGEEGIRLTQEILHSAGIQYFGLANNNVVMKIQNNSIEFNGYCCYTSNPGNFKDSDHFVGGGNILNSNNISNNIQEISHRGNLPIVSIHAGVEHINFPDISNIIWSRELAEKAPYIYYGHHPHVLQGLEMYKGSLIVHSLGNFIFDNVIDEKGNIKVKLTENNRFSAILEIEIENNQIISYRLKPIHIGTGYIELMEYSSISPINYDFSEALINPKEYTKKRNRMISEHISERKNMRNAKWILRHLTPRYVKLFFDMKKNKKLYRENVLQYLDRFIN